MKNGSAKVDVRTGGRALSGLEGTATEPTPTKKLSSKILDMKFMQRAETKQKEDDEREQQQMAEDESRWSLASPDTKIKPRVVTVGFSDLAEGPPLGRRSFGKKAVSVEDEEVNAEGEDDEEDTTPLKRKNSEKPKKAKKAKK